MRHVPMAVYCALGAAIAGAISTGASAEVVAYWHFNGFDPANGPVVAASSGSGSLDCSSFGTGLTAFGGTDVNALEGVVAGDSLGLTGSSHNGSIAQFNVGTAGFADLTLSFAARRSSTGFGNDRLEALVSGVWTLVTTFNPSTVAWTSVSINLSDYDTLENGNAAFRMVFDGATSGSGTVRFDNVTVSGSAVPAPGAMALVGLAGLVGSRRRRH